VLPNMNFTNIQLKCKYTINLTYKYQIPQKPYQSMQNLFFHRSMTGKTCLRLVEILGLPVTMFIHATDKNKPWQVIF